MFTQYSISQSSQQSQYQRNQLSLVQQYLEQINQIQKLKKKQNKKKQKKKKQFNIGHWNNLEKSSYIQFLSEYKQNFSKKQLRRTDKIFKLMSSYIKSRNADQCRSHHQKMQKKYKSLQNIIISIKRIQMDKQLKKEQVVDQNIKNECIFLQVYDDVKQEGVNVQYKQNEDIKQTNEFELYELNFDGFNEIEIGWNFEGDGDCNYF